MDPARIKICSAAVLRLRPHFVAILLKL
jgi:hypothetical protein